MAWVIAGLGNPGDDYSNTRHNAGRMAVEYFAKAAKFKEWKEDKKVQATVSSGAIDKEMVALVLPDTYMNKSGNAVAKYVKSQKAAERLIVAYDDLDLPLGKLKISFDRGSGGHKGIESIIRAVKTKKFTRIRIGVSPATASGKIRKPDGGSAVNDFILGRFKAGESEELKSIFKKITHALAIIVADGPQKAMNEFN